MTPTQVPHELPLAERTALAQSVLHIRYSGGESRRADGSGGSDLTGRIPGVIRNVYAKVARCPVSLTVGRAGSLMGVENSTQSQMKTGESLAP